MNPLKLDVVMQSVRSLPALPMVVLDLLSSIDQDDVNIGELAKKIALDPGLTARSLRLANSSFYGMAQQVNTIQEAIVILGFRTMRSVVSTAAILDAFPSGIQTSFKVASFWRHAIAVGLCAKELAPYLKLHPEHAYAAGLLHDVGRLVLVTQFHSEYEATMAYRSLHDCSLLDAERAVLQVDHAVVGHLLAKHWKFSESMQVAVAAHHSPLTETLTPLTTLLVAADAIAHALDLSMDEDDSVPVTTDIFWRTLGISEESLLKIFSNVEKQFAGASLILNT